MAAVIFLAGYTFGLNFRVPAPTVVSQLQLENSPAPRAVRKNALHQEGLDSKSKHLNEKILSLIETQKQTVSDLEKQIDEQESSVFSRARQLDALRNQMAQEQEILRQLQLQSQLELTNSFSNNENRILEQGPEIIASQMQQDQTQQQIRDAQARVNQLSLQAEARRKSNIDYVDNDAMEAELQKARQELARLQQGYYSAKAQQITSSGIDENSRQQEKMNAEASQRRLEQELSEHRQTYERLEKDGAQLSAQVQKDDTALSELTDRYNEEMRKLRNLESAITNL